MRLRRQLLQLLVPASDETVRDFMKDKKRLLAIRLRMSGISWSMAYLKEPSERAASGSRVECWTVIEKESRSKNRDSRRNSLDA